MNSIMRLREVSAFYGSRQVLRDVTMDIPRRQITAIIGPSGCGKSTLLRCMNGLLAEESGASATGEIFLGETPIGAMRPDELRRRVGLVFQTPAPFPFSVSRNMTFAPKYYGLRDKQKLDALAEEKLRLCGLYGEVRDGMDRSALKLSGGQQQRLCIARALTVEPEVLMLDEPCSALDVKSTETIEALLRRLRERYTVVIVTHNLAQARRISDRAVFLFNGAVVEQGASAELFSAPREEETKRFLDGAFG